MINAISSSFFLEVNFILVDYQAQLLSILFLPIFSHTEASVWINHLIGMVNVKDLCQYNFAPLLCFIRAWGSGAGILQGQPAPTKAK